MTSFDAFPGAPLIVRADWLSEATLGVAVRSRKDKSVYGVTARDLLLSSQPIAVVDRAESSRSSHAAQALLLRVGKRTLEFPQVAVTPGQRTPVTNLVGFFEFEKSTSISDKPHGEFVKISKTVDPESALDRPWFVLRRNGVPLKTEWSGYDVAFEFESVSGEKHMVAGGVEIAAPENAIMDGDAGAPVVTDAGELIGIIVAASDQHAMLAPVHKLFAGHDLEIFARAAPLKLVHSAEPEKTSIRMCGVNIPVEKQIWIALTYIYGIGRPTALEICAAVNIPPETRGRTLQDSQILTLRQYVEKNHVVEGDLRRKVALDIKRLTDNGCYRGLRHRKGLPVRGQRTHTNARTRKGKAKAIPGKKKVTK